MRACTKLLGRNTPEIRRIENFQKRQERNIAIMCKAKFCPDEAKKKKKKEKSHSNTAALFRTGFAIQRDGLSPLHFIATLDRRDSSWYLQ